MPTISRYTVFFLVLILFAVVTFAVTAGCSKMNEEATTKDPKAIARLYPTEGSKVEGTVLFSDADNGTQIEVDLKGLTPGKHGFHIHTRGDCRAADGTSAGGHFNPDHSPHGAPDSAKRHVGDLGNITAKADGTVSNVWVDKRISLTGPQSIIGRSIIVHAGADDFTSQPSGAAGKRVACGVIGLGGGS